MVQINPQLQPLIEIEGKFQDLLDQEKEHQRKHRRRLRISLWFLGIATALNFFSFVNNAFLGWY